VSVCEPTQVRLHVWICASRHFLTRFRRSAASAGTHLDLGQTHRHSRPRAAAQNALQKSPDTPPRLLILGSSRMPALNSGSSLFRRADADADGASPTYTLANAVGQSFILTRVLSRWWFSSQRSVILAKLSSTLDSSPLLPNISHRTRAKANARTTRVPSSSLGCHRWRNPRPLPHPPQNVLPQGCSRTWVRRISSRIYSRITNRITIPILIMSSPPLASWSPSVHTKIPTIHYSLPRGTMDALVLRP